MRREIVDRAPKPAPGRGIDARGRLVEEQHRRAVQQGAAQGEPLLPATGELAGELAQPGADLEERDDLGHAGTAGGAGQPVNRGVEGQVFAGGEILVQPELLRHVADALADLLGRGGDVDARHGGGAR